MAKQNHIVELFYDSQWNNHTSEIYTRDLIRLSHGKTDAYSSAQPASCGLTFDDRDAKFNPRNPSSSLYGKIGRYTPLRIRYGVVTEGFEDGTLDITTTDGPGSPNWARTMTQAHSGSWSFGAEGVSIGNVSEVDVTVPDGATALSFWYYVHIHADNLEVLVDDSVVHDTLDDDTFQEWTLLTIDVSKGSVVTFRHNESGGVGGGVQGASFIDDLSFDDVRFSGEISSWRPRRVIKGDAWTEVVAHGISHRLGQGSIESLSPMRDFIEREASDVLAYWPMEDGALASSALGQGSGSPTDLVGITFFGAFPNLFEIGGELTTLASGALAPWLPNGMAAADFGGFLTMTSTPDTQGWWIDLVFRGASSGDVMRVLVEGNGAGSGGAEKTEWLFFVSDDGTSNQNELGIDDGSVAGYLLSGIEVSGDTLGDSRLHHLRIFVQQLPPDELRIFAYVDGGEVHSDTFNGESVILDGIAAVGVLGDFAVGHLAVGTTAPTDLDDHVNAAFGHPGQFVNDRMADVAAQYDGLNVAFTGDTDDVLAVGPRYTEPMLKVIRDAAAVDLGILHDDIVARQLRYRTGRSLYSQDAALTLDWDSGEIGPPLEPDIDDLDLRNRIVVRRRDGKQTSKRDETSISNDGLVNANHTLNVPADGDFIEHQAAWRLHLGTSDETRFPRVTIDLDAAPELVDDVAAIRIGDRLDLTNLPDDVSVDDVSLLIFGWTEIIGSHRRKITLNCAPEAPYRVAAVGGGASIGTVGSESATLNEDLTDAETAVDIDCGAGGAWVHEGTNYGIVVNGERMTVTAVGAASGTFPDETQTLTVTRSVNGVTRAHSNGDPVSMAEPAYIGL